MNKRHFTLIELMAAMVVLLIMMGFLFHFIISSQNLWSASERNARIYENAQVFFDLLDRDLGGVMVSKVPGQEIGFWIGDPTPAGTSNPFLSMVSMVPQNMMPSLAVSPDGRPNICEVHYSRQLIATDPPADVDVFRIVRAVVSEKKEDGSKDSDWDFYGNNAVSAPGWLSRSNAKELEVIDGVEDITISFFSKDDLVNPLPGSLFYRELPSAVRVSVTLVDQKVYDLKLSGSPRASRLDASRRKFTRVFLLSR